MREGFIFNHYKCVSCKACSAACILENGWAISPRNIYTYNSEAESSLHLINLALACNHCESAVCMDGCPSSAYKRDPVTGAIILDEIKCIGCRYCQWNCPYDAPKYDHEKKTITKCNLCYNGLKTGRQPACSSACPTGALRFGQLSLQKSYTYYSWFPGKNLDPAIEFSANQGFNPLRIIPENINKTEITKPVRKEKRISEELSLILFSFLSIVSVATVISSFFRGVFPERTVFFPVIVLAALASFFHLGKPVRSWRSVANFKHSPLSREIVFLIIYITLCAIILFFQLPGLLIAASVAGLCLLLAIDSVYIFADKKKSVTLHSGQAFLSALMIASFFSGIILPFIFIALVKLAVSVYGLIIKRMSPNFEIRFLRMAFLIVTGIRLISHNPFPDLITISIFLTGEFFDRMLFYIDFDPVNINTLIDRQLNIERDEKKRG